MLPARHRLRSPADFQATIRRGRKSAQRDLIAYLLLADPTTADGFVPEPARIGFVVSKQVGGATTRHLVSRRLRHAMHAHLLSLPAGARLVVRALPGAATATFAALDAQLTAAVKTVSAANAKAGA